MHSILFVALSIVTLFLSSCAAPTLRALKADHSNPQAIALWEASKGAHGQDSFRRLKTVTVKYEGEWASIGPKFQPVLADTEYRKKSVETLSLQDRSISQDHSGPKGQKHVTRNPTSISVSYDGNPTMDSQTLDAAAVVADAYQMFILGPFFFDRPGVTWVEQPDSMIDETPVHQLLAVLRPGLGNSEEDRVLLSIESASHRLLRVLFTLNGFGGTRGAEVDVSFSDFREEAGVLWPRYFIERIRAPLRLAAHEWRVLDIEAQ